MLNSTKAGDEDTLWGLKVRGVVIDTRLTIWWSGIADPTEDSKLGVDFNRLKVRFSVFAGDSDETSALAQAPGLTQNLKSDPSHDQIQLRTTESIH